LKQVFLNLILNACDAMPKGGDLTLTIETDDRADKSVVVSVEDSGCGIPDEMLRQIFNPFFTTKHHGTGLGLAITNRIILNHYGSIEAHNTGQGALFKITLPLADYSPPISH
jgi:signal transduction histidine kinase